MKKKKFVNENFAEGTVSIGNGLLQKSKNLRLQKM